MAEARKELNALKADKKLAAAGFKEQIDKLDAKLDHLAGVIRDKREYRSTECKWVRDNGRMMMVCVRLDSGVQVDHRPMTDKERQGELFEEGAKDAAEAAAPPSAEVPDAPPAAKKRGRPKKDTTAANGAANGAAHAEPPVETPAAVQ
jgi:hypothetical protein